ncbi:MAG TPA: histidine phosphatase family protein [Spirochaetia bacterium]|nr:histidine phosphatase family protein [Spirochaetia bacterium]
MSPQKENHRPLELVFVRHGESEGNVANHAAEAGDSSHFTDEFRTRHSSTWNLTPLGEEQAKAAGDWIKKNINQGVFDAYYASTYRRAKRTAGLLDLPNASWRLRDYIREHDWGILDVMTDEERREKYPDVMRNREMNPYYFAAPGGESLADVLIRARVGIMATLYRDLPNKRGIVVSHGNMMWPIRIIMEGILPEEYLELKAKKDPRDKINNCQIFQYTRINPTTGEITEKFSWMRSVCPWKLDPALNEWRPILHKKYTNEELVKA